MKLIRVSGGEGEISLGGGVFQVNFNAFSTSAKKAHYTINASISCQKEWLISCHVVRKS